MRSAEEADIGNGFQEALVAVEKVTADDPRDRTRRSLHELARGGWLDLPNLDGVTVLAVADAVRFAYGHVPYLSLPLVEVWAGLLIAPSAKSVELPAPVAVADVTPGHSQDGIVTTGWVPDYGQESAWTVIKDEEGKNVVLSVPRGSQGEREASSPDLLSAWMTLAAPRSDCTVLGELGGEQLRSVRDRVLVVQAAALLGQAEALFDRTHEFVMTRHQFGVAIGSLQALKHRLADMYTELHAAEKLVSWSCRVDPKSEQTRSVSSVAAKAYAARVATRVAHESVQLHGAMGFAWETGIHLAVRRSAHLSVTGTTQAAAEAWLTQRVLTDTPVWSDIAAAVPQM